MGAGAREIEESVSPTRGVSASYSLLAASVIGLARGTKPPLRGSALVPATATGARLEISFERKAAEHRA